MDEHTAPDRGVERRMRLEVLFRADDEIDLTKSRLFRSAPGGFDGAPLSVDPDDRSRRSDKLGHEHRNVANAAADVEHAHPRLDAAFIDQPPR